MFGRDLERSFLGGHVSCVGSCYEGSFVVVMFVCKKEKEPAEIFFENDYGCYFMVWVVAIEVQLKFAL
jgi:hypothetical protein